VADIALLLTAGIAIGLSVTAPLGPVNVLVIRTALRRNFAVAFLVGAGAVVADTVFAIVAAYGVRSIERFITDYALLLTLAAGVLMVAMGLRIARTHMSLAEVQTLEPPSKRQIARKMLTTFTLTITNPATLFGFLAIFGTMSAVLKLSAAAYRPLLTVAGVAIGGLAWWLFLGFIVDRLKSRISGALFDRINKWTGVLIAAFGFVLLFDAIF